MSLVGVPVHDADATNHRLMAPGGNAFDRVAEIFPEVIQDGRIDRQMLGKIVFGDGRALERLEAIFHPLIRAAESGFCAQQMLGRKLWCSIFRFI